jgi:hypothetical protein
MPAALAASATVKEPTAVLAAPAPSLSVSVAVLPLVLTLCSEPFDGTLARVQELVFEDDASDSLNVTWTLSTLPFEFVSNISMVVRAGASLSIVYS